MEKDTNVLSHIVRNENDTTRLLYALLKYKPVRDVLMKLFTKGKCKPGDVAWEEVYVHTTIEGVIPDLLIQGEKVNIVIEVKTTSHRGLTNNQPEAYLSWLTRQSGRKSGFFVAIVPPKYNHLAELQTRIDAFGHINDSNIANTSILDWNEIIGIFTNENLDQLSIYVNDFCNLIRSRYNIPTINLTFDEVNTMFDTKAPKALKKLMGIVEEVTMNLDEKGYTISRSFKKRWWEDDYGAYVLYKEHYVLWFGLWMEYWESKGMPLCFAVHSNEWNDAVCAKFKKLYPKHTVFPENDANAYLTVSIEKHVMLSEDPVARILVILENCLTHLCEEIR